METDRAPPPSSYLSSIMALSYIFIHFNISLKLLQTPFPLKCLKVMSYLSLCCPLRARKIDLIQSTTVPVSDTLRAYIYIYFRQNITKRIFAVVYCGSLNGCFVFAKTFKLLDDFPHGGFSSVCIFSCSVEPLMQEKK